MPLRPPPGVSVAAAGRRAVGGPPVELDARVGADADLGQRAEEIGVVAALALVSQAAIFTHLKQN